MVVPNLHLAVETRFGLGRAAERITQDVEHHVHVGRRGPEDSSWPLGGTQRGLCGCCHQVEGEGFSPDYLAKISAYLNKEHDLPGWQCPPLVQYHPCRVQSRSNAGRTGGLAGSFSAPGDRNPFLGWCAH